MARIELGPLTDRLDDDEIAELSKALEKLGAPRLPRGDESAAATMGDGIDEDVMAEFLDRLEAEDIACDVYLPIEFDGVVEAGHLRLGSAAVLVDVLDELRDDFEVPPADAEEAEDEDEDEDDEDDDEPEDEEDLDRKLVEAQLRRLWKVLRAGAEAAMERKLPLYVTSD